MALYSYGLPQTAKIPGIGLPKEAVSDPGEA